MKQVFDTMSQATGVDFSEIIRANTYDAKVTKNIHVTGNGAEENAATDTASDTAADTAVNTAVDTAVQAAVASAMTESENPL